MIVVCMCCNVDAPAGILGRNEIERTQVQEFAALCNLPHKPIYAGAVYKPTKLQMAAEYVETQQFEVHFSAIEKTFNAAKKVPQIAIILAPPVENPVSGKKFYMKISHAKESVSQPVYLARVKDVKRVAAASEDEEEQRLVSWEYYEPTKKLLDGKCILGHIAAAKNDAWRLDSRNPQLDQPYDRGEIVAVWDMDSDRQIFPVPQYNNAVQVLNSIIHARDQLNERRAARDRDETVADSTADEDSDDD